MLQSFNDLLSKVESADNGLLIEKHGKIIADRLAKAQKMTSKRKNEIEEQRLGGARDEAYAQVSFFTFLLNQLSGLQKKDSAYNGVFFPV